MAAKECCGYTADLYECFTKACVHITLNNFCQYYQNISLRIEKPGG